MHGTAKAVVHGIKMKLPTRPLYYRSGDDSVLLLPWVLLGFEFQSFEVLVSWSGYAMFVFISAREK